jgi:hypothetical protein
LAQNSPHTSETASPLMNSTPVQFIEPAFWAKEQSSSELLLKLHKGPVVKIEVVPTPISYETFRNIVESSFDGLSLVIKVKDIEGELNLAESDQDFEAIQLVSESNTFNVYVEKVPFQIEESEVVVLNQLPLSVLIIDRESHIVFGNSKFCKGYRINLLKRSKETKDVNKNFASMVGLPNTELQKLCATESIYIKDLTVGNQTSTMIISAKPYKNLYSIVTLTPAPQMTFLPTKVRKTDHASRRSAFVG